MGLWSVIKKSVNNDLTTPLDTLIKTVVNTSATPLNTQLSSISTRVSAGSVKSVQRGKAQIPISSSTSNLSITAVNPLKCIVTLHGACMKLGSMRSGDTYMEAAPYVFALTATQLSVGTNGDTADTQYSGGGSMAIFSWEIIEFY